MNVPGPERFELRHLVGGGAAAAEGQPAVVGRQPGGDLPPLFAVGLQVQGPERLHARCVTCR